jgi:hypothetical protein
MRFARQRHKARVVGAEEMRMGSPQYGRLVLDGEPVEGAGAIESESLVWSHDRGLLAVQELVDWRDEPRTRIVVIQTESVSRIAESAAEFGLSAPVCFEADELVYRHWQFERGEQERRLPIRS